MVVFSKKLPKLIKISNPTFSNNAEIRNMIKSEIVLPLVLRIFAKASIKILFTLPPHFREE